MDWDLLLWDSGNSVWTYTSQSYDNSTEGFEFKLPATSKYELWVRHPASAVAGDGSTDAYMQVAAAWGAL